MINISSFIPIIGIYKIVSPSNKIYIGQSVDVKRRYQEYQKLQCKGQPKLHYSLLKYGWDKHTFELIEQCTEDQLNEREIYWGLKFDVLNKGLNCSLGKSGGRQSLETINKKSKSIKYAFDNMSKEDKKDRYTKILESRPGQYKKSNKIRKIHKSRGPLSDEIKHKISQTHSGKPKKKGYKQTQNHIMSRLENTYISVMQYDKNNNFIKEWPSMQSAAGYLGLITHKGISHCCRGKQKTAFGFIWKFKLEQN
jgi:group I intron endonuclease